jgi:hypothetical protein
VLLFDLQTWDALVNVCETPSGMGAARLPLRKAGIFGFFETTSVKEGKSGEEEISTLAVDMTLRMGR